MGRVAADELIVFNTERKRVKVNLRGLPRLDLFRLGESVRIRDPHRRRERGAGGLHDDRGVALHRGVVLGDPEQRRDLVRLEIGDKSEAVLL